MDRMFLTGLAELLQLELVRMLLLVFGRMVTPVFTLRAFEYDMLLRHRFYPVRENSHRHKPHQRATKFSNGVYSMTWVTTPAPTVCPPSRMANLSSFSSAIGVI